MRRSRDTWLRLALSVFLFAYLGFVLATLLADAIWLVRTDPLTGASALNQVLGRAELRDEISAAMKLTFQTSLCTVCLAMLVAVPSAYALSRFRWPLLSVIDTVIDLPLVVPPLIAGISLLLFFKQSPTGRWADDALEIVYSRKAIVVAQFFIAAAFGIRAVKATFDGINPRFEHVARSLGCGPWQAFHKIALPLARNGIVAGAVMTWARAMGEFAPVMILAGATAYRPGGPPHTEVLSVAAFLNLSSGHVEIAIAVTLLMVVLGAVTLLLFKRLGGQGYLW